MEPPEPAVRRPSTSDHLVLLLSTLLFVDTFLPWYRGSAPIIRLDFSVNAWDLGGRWQLVGLLAITAAVLAVLPLVGFHLLDAKRMAGLLVLDAGAAFLFAVLALAVQPGGAERALLGIGRAPALFVAPLLAVALLAAALRKAKESGM